MRNVLILDLVKWQAFGGQANRRLLEQMNTLNVKKEVELV